MANKCFVIIVAQDGRYVKGYSSLRGAGKEFKAQAGRELTNEEIARVERNQSVRVVDIWGRVISIGYGKSATCKNCKKVTLVHTIKEGGKEYNLCSDCYDLYECGVINPFASR